VVALNPPVVAQTNPARSRTIREGTGDLPLREKSHGPLIKTARYIGNKWGGKYLRAPDIFFTILEKGKGKLVRLGDIAEVRRGFTTGANKFFYLEPTGKPAPAGYLHVRNGAGWEGEIEEEFLKPVIKSPRECRSILIKPEDLRYKIFMCHRDKSELKGTAALEYIRWGETQRYHERPSCRGRQRWWDVGMRRHCHRLSHLASSDPGSDNFIRHCEPDMAILAFDRADICYGYSPRLQSCESSVTCRAVANS
jgi:hypothetical protein